MNEELNLIKNGLEKANQRGTFTLEESSILLTALVKLNNYINGEDKGKKMVKTSDKAPVSKNKS